MLWEKVKQKLLSFFEIYTATRLIDMGEKLPLRRSELVYPMLWLYAAFYGTLFVFLPLAFAINKKISLKEMLEREWVLLTAITIGLVIICIGIISLVYPHKRF